MIIENVMEMKLFQRICKLRNLSNIEKATINNALREFDPKIKMIKNETLSVIQFIIASHFKVNPDFLDTDSRDSDIVYGRQLLWYFTELYFKKIPLKVRGFHFGRDHATALYGYIRIKDKLTKYEHVRQDVVNLDRKIRETMDLQNRIQYRHF